MHKAARVKGEGMFIREMPAWAAELSLAERVAAARGIAQEQLEDFLNPRYCKLPLDAYFPPAELAARKLADAILAKKRILVWGDYDADGVCALAIMTQVLKDRTVFRIHVPERTDGYGVNADILRKLVKEFHPDMLLTVDCGITANACITELNMQGVSVIVTDHHLAREKPEADAVVDPILEECGQYKYLCGAGVAWLIAERTEGILAEHGLDTRACSERLMLAGIATVADVVPLQGVNRFLVRHALEQLVMTDHPGLCILKERMRLTEKTRLSALDIGFRIGPCINAAGRVDSPLRAFTMLCGQDEMAQRAAAEECYACNEKRKALEAAILRDLDETELGQVLVVDAPSGILGLLAGRLTEKIGLPAVVLRVEDGIAFGSCRSPDGYPLNEILADCSSLLLSFGGHAKAAGCSLHEKDISDFRDRFIARCRKYSPLPFEPVADMQLSSDMITMEAFEDLYRLEPCGEGNPQALFYLPDAEIVNVKVSKNGLHLLFTVKSGDKQFYGKMWRASDLYNDVISHPRRGLLLHITEPYCTSEQPELEVVNFL